MIIKNFKTIVNTQARKDALEIINAGIEAVLTKPAMYNQIILSNDILHIQKKSWDLSKYQRIFIVGAGKAAADMAEALEHVLGKKVNTGIVIDTQKRKLKNIRVVEGTHPLPSQVNIKATQEIIGLLNTTTKEDLVLCLISGGGSALLEDPIIPLDKLIQINKDLLHRGATIQEINTIRKHLSRIKGGQLAQLAAPATLITLVISDVITNDLEVIASGPTVRDSTTVHDAHRIQKKYLLPSLPFIETPKIHLLHATNIILLSNIPAAEAMKKKAKILGYQAKILTTQMSGEASTIGKELAQKAKPKKAIILVGESTVTVKGKGKGGRNQELALAASLHLKQGVIASCSSDGVDFITAAAGGIVDQTTKELAQKNKIDIKKYLNNNDSFHALKKFNSLIITGKTGTNVCDLVVVLGKK